MIYKDKEYKTFGELFNLALKLAKENKSEAIEWFKEYVQYIMIANNKTDWDEAVSIAKSNLGYFAGYYDAKTYDLIYETYQCSHPIFGNKPSEIDPREAFRKGFEKGNSKEE